MRFFDREREIGVLRTIRQQALSVAQFTVLTGRRRIGKTSLVFHAYQDQPFLYFFVSKKAETELCETFRQEITDKLGIPLLGNVSRFSSIFEYVMLLSKRQPITLFIDEFQEFLRVNASVYSDMQRIWDIHKDEAHINLIVGGSVHSLIHRIFEDKKEPLYNRQTSFIRLKAFPPSVLKQILSTYNPSYHPEDLLTLYSLTGGVAKYVELLMDKGAVSHGSMLKTVIQPDSIFLAEGKNLLIDEFGKEYGIYFSILTAIATGHTQRNQIQDVLGKEVGGYLTMLEDNYGLIRRHKPIFSHTNGQVRYALDDNFLIFWFRFLFKYNHMIEIEAFDALLQLVERDYPTFSGMLLERYFKEQMIEQQRYTRIDSWWSRNGETEIDLIALNELNRTADFYEVKRNEKELDINVLEHKRNEFLTTTRELKNYNIHCFGLSMQDM